MAKLDPYSPALRELLHGVPPGMPRHDWLNKVAFYGIRHRSPDRLVETLNAVADREGWNEARDFSNEIKRAVKDAVRAINAGWTPGEKTPAWPAPSPEARAKRSGDLVKPVPCGAEVWDAWKTLFAPGDLVCASMDEFNAETRPRDAWKDFVDGLQFVVPNAMAAESAPMPDGRLSSRCRGNSAKRRRWLVVECDLGTDISEQCQVLSSLDHPRCPLTLAVFSGGKSVHGWFDGAALSDKEQVRWYRHAVYLGHDSKLWLKWQWVRNPGGRRANGRKQEIYFLKT